MSQKEQIRKEEKSFNFHDTLSNEIEIRTESFKIKNVESIYANNLEQDGVILNGNEYLKNRIVPCDNLNEIILESSKKEESDERRFSFNPYKKAKLKAILGKKISCASLFEKLRETFIEWSLLTKFDCYSKIFEYKSRIGRCIWLIAFLLFSSLTIWLLEKCIGDYLNYEIVTKTEIVYERPTEFPTITICDSNPFKTKFAEEFVRSVSSNYLFQVLNMSSVNLNKTNLDQIESNLTYKMAVKAFQILTELAKINSSLPEQTDQFKKSLGLSLSNIIDCQFNKIICDNADFHWYWSYDYGNCWQFNSGLNFYGQKIPIKSSKSGGNQYGLTLTLTGLIAQNTFPTSSSSGLMVFIHNHSYYPISMNGVAIERGKETMISIEKTFTFNQPMPYTECQDLSSLNSELYTLISYSKYTYTQSICLSFCIQKLIIEKCECYFTKYPMIGNTRPCLTLNDIDCLFQVVDTYRTEDCESQCPLQCNDVKYDVTTSSLSYPSPELYDYVKNQLNLTNMNLSTFQRDSLMLSIYMPNTVYTSIVQLPKFSPYDLLAQIGGSLGMFLSLSLFTFIEILEIVFLALYSFFTFWRDDKMINQG